MADSLGLSGDPAKAQTTDALDEWLDTTLKQAYGRVDLDRDEDGDISEL